MPELKKLKRLATAASLQFDGATNIVQLSELDDGGSFDLHPFATETSASTHRLYFPTQDAPGYGVALEGDIATLGRVARAILSLERKGKDGEDTPPV